MKLAMVLQQIGDYPSAREHYRAALDITERVMGKTGLDYAVVETQLATLEDACGNPAAAETLYRHALEIRRKELPSGDISVVSNEAYWGRTLLKAGRSEEGRAILRKALPEWLGFFKPDSNAPEYLSARLLQTEWLLHEGRLDEAKAALPAVTRDSPAALIKRQALAAELAHRSGDAPQALSLWRETVALSSAHFGPDTAPTARWRLSLARALLDAGQAKAAMAQWRRAEAPLHESLDEGSEWLRELDRLKTDLSRAVAAGSA